MVLAFAQAWAPSPVLRASAVAGRSPMLRAPARAMSATVGPGEVGRRVRSEVVPIPRELDEWAERLLEPLQQTAGDRYGVVFDIDGVLVHGRQPLPGAAEAVRFCVENSVPHCFLTNNAMDLEVDRAVLLTSVLGADVLADRMIVAHTPLVDEPDEIKDQLVLVTGFSSRDVRDVLRAKGFRRVKSVHEFASERPYLVPNKVYEGRVKSAYEDPSVAEVREEVERVSAVVVVENSTDWHEDLQVIVDVLASDGRVGTTSGEQVVKLYCCNYDFVFAAGFHLPRLGPGAFVRCLELMYRETTGRKLQMKLFGKPFSAAFETTERRLAAQTRSGRCPDVIYMVGDNPRSDVRGANLSGPHFRSILVRTGVFHDASKPNDDDDPADYVVGDVGDAMALIRRLEEPT